MMMSRLKCALSAILLAAIICGSAAASETAGSELLEKIKRLQGRWSGPDPKISGGKISLEITVNPDGKSVSEKFHSQTAGDAATVYQDNKDGAAVLTRMDSKFTRSQLEFRFSRGDEYDFILPIGSGVKPYDAHLHEMAVTFLDEAHITQRWTNYLDGKVSEEAVYQFTKISEPKTMSKKEARRAAKAEAGKAAREAQEKEAREARKQEEAKKAKNAPKAVPERKPKDSKKPDEIKPPEVKKTKESVGNKVFKGFKKFYKVIVGD